MILSILAALLTLVIVTSGGMATTSATLVVPTDGLYYAMRHRQAGEFLGAVIIAFYAWIAFSQPRLRRLSGSLCFGAVVQGALGSIPQGASVGILHSLLAQVLLTAAIAVAVAASPSYTTPPKTVSDYGWPSLRSLSILLPLLIAIQVALGAAFRHRMLGLMPHVIGAMLVSIFILIVGSFVLQQCKDHSVLAGFGRTLMVTTFVQVFLGLAVFTVRSMPQQPAGVILIAATAHVVTGAVVLAASVALGMHIRRNVVPKAG